MESTLPPDSPPGPPALPPPVPKTASSPPPVPKPAPPKKGSSWATIGLSVLITALCLYFLGYYLPRQLALNRKKEQDTQIAAKKKAEEAERPHREILDKITDLKLHGTALPPCPLLFPLLDGKGRTTPLGSYLSYFAAKQAAYLPQSVFEIPNADQIFNDFGLFEADSPLHKAYRKQMPLCFGAKDFGEGKLLKAGRGTKVQLRFWGTRPGKEYSKTFGKGKLHLAIGWMAACLQDYAGFRPSTQQAAYMAKPIFTNDEDLTQAAKWEPFFGNGGSILVTRWDRIWAKNPENPYLLDRWLAVLAGREGKEHFNLIESLAKNHPDNTYYQFDYIVECKKVKKGEEAINAALRELKRDDNNPDWYDVAARSLEHEGYYEEAVQLLKAWTTKHPDNPEAWTTLAAHMRYWSWHGGGESTLIKARVQEGLTYAEKASQIAPGDARSWAALMAFGTDANLAKPTMEKYFQQAIRLNPYYLHAYDDYLNRLKPRGGGSEEEMLDFAEKYERYRPGLAAMAFGEVFRSDNEDENSGDLQKHYEEMRSRMKGSPHLQNFEESYRGLLKLRLQNVETWREFVSWEDLLGRQESVMAYAKKLSRKNKELKALPPYLFLYYDQEAVKFIPAEGDKKAFQDDPGIMKKTVQAYRDLVKLDPANWHIWNRLASFTLKHHDLRSADKAFSAIGNHWAPEVWSKDEFNKAYTLSQKCPDCEGTGLLSCGAPGCFHGTVPCPNHCLQLEEGEWVHMEMKGHPDTDVWRKFTNADGSWVAFNQEHLGHVIKMVNGKWADAGACPVCHGTGRVVCPVCHGKKICPTCHGTGLKPKSKKKKTI